MNWLPSFDGSLSGAPVLIVEDDFLILMELERILSEAGAEIAGTCRTVREALARIEKGGIAAAVLDMRIGSESIAPVARLLMRHGVPFVFYTGQIETDPVRAEWRGCHFVAKPSQPRTIVKAVADLLYQPATAPAERMA
jgi:DNA-binding LytR/AlgR family response regulator